MYLPPLVYSVASLPEAVRRPVQSQAWWMAPSKAAINFFHRPTPGHKPITLMKKNGKSPVRQDVYQMITDIILDKLEQGVIPWKQRWSTQGPAANYLTKKPYRSINALLLNSIDFVHPYFLTFKQTQQMVYSLLTRFSYLSVFF